ncbi:F-box protein At5g46170-like [Solanum dulcamara]|uniref:F-box protein At5g46170-like n=1 Tax=Solanum dulcamara TaxID=45834 RepID=UPI0024850A39|nr:F-box protein At5g46170-like [Solanum dulcamara]XP_055810686.1 F-box protein At5g46170-like [Solanum dulcamara]XP_055810688.1 F-box protein At5g46170-like [Solanum dulcamara]XP_055810689.1 F-box protein At5g46170-like [Solanum dulcamara]XP_055810690.1 F-box protein At5g46170-like [Solanum dulcamara]
MGSSKSDLRSTIYPEPIDHLDQLPDPVLLLVFNKIGDVKTLGRCCGVCKRFHSLVPQVDTVVVRTDCVISDDNSSSSSSSSSSSTSDKSRHPISSLFRFVFHGLVKPFQSLTQLISVSCSASSSSSSLVDDDDDFERTHHSPTQVLKNFDGIKLLRIELPTGELGIDDGALLKWRADFGSTLHNCVILGASSVIQPVSFGDGDDLVEEQCGNNGETDNGTIPESFYTNGGLKLRVVWTISSLMAASARHYLLQLIIAQHKKLENLVLTDVDRQGVLCMNREQLEELRVKPLSASSASKRTMVPALNMRWWYAPHLELPDGTVLKGATLVAIRPSEQPKKEVVGPDGNWVAAAFEEPYGTAARMLVNRRTYCLEMNSF